MRDLCASPERYAYMRDLCASPERYAYMRDLCASPERYAYMRDLCASFGSFAIVSLLAQTNQVYTNTRTYTHTYIRTCIHAYMQTSTHCCSVSSHTWRANWTSPSPNTHVWKTYKSGNLHLNKTVQTYGQRYASTHRGVQATYVNTQAVGNQLHASLKSKHVL